ncbi:hypothetical protein BJ165DRAFT_1527149 [Panaeolus papilionaceus]|nr:hypothetical protein BJ165DRAFT_1527149 [Panaeolus papilionaceus]
MASVFVDFYHSHASSSGARAFENLHELRYEIPYDDDFGCLERVLNEAKSLNVLKVNQSEDMAPTTGCMLERLQLSTKILNVFPRLTRLSLSFRITSYPLAYIFTFLQITLLLSIKFGQNTMEEFKFDIYSHFIDLDYPSSQPWSQIAGLLADPVGYPRLKKVEMSLILDAPEDVYEFLNSFQAREEELDRFMLDARSVLVARGLEFESDVYLTRM